MVRLLEVVLHIQPRIKRQFPVDSANANSRGHPEPSPTTSGGLTITESEGIPYDPYPARVSCAFCQSNLRQYLRVFQVAPSARPCVVECAGSCRAVIPACRMATTQSRTAPPGSTGEPAPQPVADRTPDIRVRSLCRRVHRCAAAHVAAKAPDR